MINTLQMFAEMKYYNTVAQHIHDSIRIFMVIVKSVVAGEYMTVYHNDESKDNILPIQHYREAATFVTQNV